MGFFVSGGIHIQLGGIHSQWWNTHLTEYTSDYVELLYCKGGGPTVLVCVLFSMGGNPIVLNPTMLVCLLFCMDGNPTVLVCVLFMIQSYQSVFHSAWAVIQLCRYGCYS